MTRTATFTFSIDGESKTRSPFVDVQDRHGGLILLAEERGRWPRLQRVFAAGGYAGKLVVSIGVLCNWEMRGQDTHSSPVATSPIAPTHPHSSYLSQPP